MKLIDIINARRIVSRVATQKMNGNLSYGIMKFIKNSNGDEDFFNSQFKMIVDKYAQKDDEGNWLKNEDGGVLIRKDAITECNSKIKELHNTRVNAPWMFNIQDIGSTDCFSPQDLFVLDVFIEGQGENV
jgi:hypothetical protein